MLLVIVGGEVWWLLKNRPFGEKRGNGSWVRVASKANLFAQQ